MEQETSALFEYDVFLSYSSKDNPISLKIERGLERSHVLVVCMSKHAFASQWTTLEQHTAIFRDPMNSRRRLVPLRLDDAKAPALLNQLAYIDWRAKRDAEYSRLVATIKEQTRTAQSSGSMLPGSSSTRRVSDDLETGIVHPLPPAPCFTGRTGELRHLFRHWNSEKSIVVALVGIGGAGKTALASAFVDSVLTGEGASLGEKAVSPASIFIWSFYVDQNIDSFLERAYAHFASGASLDAKGTGAVYRLIDALTRGGHHLIVLDGL